MPLLKVLSCLISSCKTAEDNLIDGLIVNENTGYYSLFHSPALTTALVPHIGYHKATELAQLMKDNKYDIFEANAILKILDDARLKEILQPGNLLKLGFSLEDLK